jgi:hypothetical protein
VVHVDNSSDEDIELLNVGGSAEINQDEDDTPPTPTLSPLMPRNKRQRVEARDALPAVPQQLGTLDLITALRADTSFDGGIWSQANVQDQKF